MESISKVLLYSFDLGFRKRSYRNCSTFVITTKRWNQLQKDLTTVMHNIYIWPLHHISLLNDLWNWITIFHNTPLISASEKGHIEIVQLLLSQPGFEINGRNIWIQLLCIKLTLTFFLAFPLNHFWIEYRSLIILIWFLLQREVMPKLSNFC